MNIILGVTGGIAAYKAAILVRLLVKEGHAVQVVMTHDASSFITPLTLSTLSKRPVLTNFFDSVTGNWNNHVEWAEWADAIIIAPASSNTLAKMSSGICDNLLLAIYQSARSSVYVAPAMDLEMYQHFTVKRNLRILEENNILIIPPGTGELASGLSGEGRMAEPVEIVDFIRNAGATHQIFKGKKILITAGPTYEKLDPVRFIGNFSTGKMGFELARTCISLGAEVVLISGPTHLHPPISEKLRYFPVTSALEMFEQSLEHFPQTDIAILSAAVADYRPQHQSNVKIKKEGSGDDHISLDLIKNPDILYTLGSMKNDQQILVGFSLETNNEDEFAISKLHKKNCDVIVMNSLQDKGAGFGGETNKVSIFLKNGEIYRSELKSKSDIAKDICKVIEKLIV